MHRRRRLGDRAQLHRLRPACQRRDGGDVRRAPRTTRRRTASGRSSRSTASTSSTPPRPRSARSSSGATSGPKGHDLSSLRLLGTVGEPINPEAWMWYHEVIGGGRCPIVDTWWQTETGAIMISPLPGAIADQARLARRKPLPGRRRRGRRQAGQPGARRTRAGSWSSAAVAGDAADDLRRRRALQAAVLEPGARHATSPPTAPRSDEDGYFWIMGRVDDVLNVAGHRLSTMEVESALVHHPKVAEAAVVGQPDEIKGEGIACFVTLEAGHRADRRAEEGAAGARRQGDRRAGPAGRDPLHRRAAEDAHRARSCGGCCATSPRGRQTTRRHDDAGGLQRAGEAARGGGVRRAGMW